MTQILKTNDLNLDSYWNILDSQLKKPYKEEFISCCDSPRILDDSRSGTAVCVHCGVVSEASLIDLTPEWRDFSNENSTSMSQNRCGMPSNPLFDNDSLGTLISGGSFMAKMNNWGKMSYEDRAIWEMRKDILSRVQEYNIPKGVVDEVLLVFKKIAREEIHRGKVKEGLIANCFYYTFKNHGINYAIKEIAEMLKIDIEDMIRCRKKYFDIMGVGSEIISPDTLIERFSHKLSLPQKVINIAKDIYIQSEQLNLLSGSNPQSIASGIIYFMTEELKLDIHKTIVSDVCGVRDVTTMKIYKKILEQKQIIFTMLKNKKNNN